MLNIAICDDEEFFQKEIKQIVSSYMQRQHLEYNITIFGSGDEFVKLGSDMGQFRIVYLDINMEGLDGIETARKLRHWCSDTFLVFVTAFINYTLDGYKVEAIRYILKDADNLKGSVEESLDVILEKLHISRKQYTFEFKEGVRTFSAQQLIYAESNLHTVYVHILEKGQERTYSYMGKLGDFETQLNDERFIRIHQSFIVNMKYIQQIGREQAVLENGKILPIARARKDHVKDSFLVYKGDF